MKALSSTGYLKTLITASSPIDVEAKNKQSELITLYTRVIWFGNGSLKALHDHSEGFSRRFIIIRVKPKPKDRIDDPHLTEKILFEKDEIFRWMLQGLQRLIANDFKFTISERTRQTIETAIDLLDRVQGIAEREKYIAEQYNEDGGGSLDQFQAVALMTGTLILMQD